MKCLFRDSFFCLLYRKGGLFTIIVRTKNDGGIRNGDETIIGYGMNVVNVFVSFLVVNEFSVFDGRVIEFADFDWSELGWILILERRKSTVRP